MERAPWYCKCWLPNIFKNWRHSAFTSWLPPPGLEKCGPLPRDSPIPVHVLPRASCSQTHWVTKACIPSVSCGRGLATRKVRQANRARPQSWEDCSCKCAPWTVCYRLQQFPGGPRLDLGVWGEAWETGCSSNTPSYCRHIKWGLWNYYNYRVVGGGCSDQQVMAHSCRGRKPLSPSLPHSNAAPSSGRVGFLGGAGVVLRMWV